MGDGRWEKEKEMEKESGVEESAGEEALQKGILVEGWTRTGTIESPNCPSDRQ